MRQGKLSIIIPLYCEAEHFHESFRVILDTVKTLPEPVLTDWEFVLVDDGSSDATWAVLRQIASEFSGHVSALRFSRNFGKEAAIRAGLEHASGDAAIIMDGDLQHPPALITDMFALWAENEIDIVNTVKTDRGQESIPYRFMVTCFNLFMNSASAQYQVGDSDYKLLDRKVINAFLELKERRTYFRGLVNWLGFRNANLPLQVKQRAAGQTKWRLRSLLYLGMTALTSFSTLALHFVTIAGLIFAAISGVLGLFTLIKWWSGSAIEGFTTIILLQLIVGSIIMVALGIIGEYLSIVYMEVKGRPRFFLLETLEPERKAADHE